MILPTHNYPLLKVEAFGEPKIEQFRTEARHCSLPSQQEIAQTALEMKNGISDRASKEARHMVGPC